MADLARPREIPPADRLGLSRILAASLIGVSAGTFDGMVLRGEMPRPKRIGARCVWSRAEIEAAFNRLPDGTPVGPSSERDRREPVGQTVSQVPPWERRP